MSRNVDRRGSVEALNDAVQVSGRTGQTAPYFGQVAYPSGRHVALGKLYSVGAEGDDWTYRLPIPQKSDVGKTVTFRNLSDDIVVVHSQAGVAINDGLQKFNIYHGGRCVTFVVESLNRYVTIGDSVSAEPILENWPVFKLHATAGETLVAQSKTGCNTTLAVELSNKKVYFAQSPLTVNVLTTGIGGVDNTLTTGVWNVWAVNSAGGREFDLLASKTYVPGTNGPTGYAYRYLWSLSCANAETGALRNFVQAGNRSHADSPNNWQLMEQNAWKTPSGTNCPADNTWFSLDQTATNGITTAISTYLDPDAVSAIGLYTWMDFDPVNALQTCRILVAGWSNDNTSPNSSATTVSGAGMLEAQIENNTDGRATGYLEIPFNRGASWAKTVTVFGSVNVECRMFVKWYEDKFYQEKYRLA